MRAHADVVERHQLTQTTLGDLAEYITSGSRDWSKYYAGSGAMFIRTQNINQNRLSLEEIAYVQLPARVEGKRSLVRKGDLLITITGANVGKVAVVEQKLPEAYVSQSVCLVRLRDPSLAKFLQLQLIARRGDKSALESMAYGLGRPVLNLENVRAVPVMVGPPRITAEIVAEVERQLSRLDEAVANLKRVKANLNRYLAATLGAAFSGKWSGTEADWRPVPLREVADVQLGQQRAPVHAMDSNPIPYVRAANVTWRGLDLSDIKSMGFPNAARYRLAYGDILLAEASGSANEVGKPAIWRDEIPGACYQKTLIRVRCRPELLHHEFAYYFFLHTVLSGQFARLAPGVGILHLTAERMLVWPMLAPPLCIQASVIAEVDRRLSVVRKVESMVDANLKREQALRQAVLARALLSESLGIFREVAARI